MRTAAVIVAVFMLPRCFVETLTTTAIQGELHARQLQTAKKALDGVKEFKTETEVRSAIEAYKAEHERTPPSLDALVPDYLATYPVKPDGTPYGYDPTTGKLAEGPVQTPVAQPSADPLAADRQEMEQIRQAIDRYGRATGYYPTSLWALVPDYLPEYPKTAGGQDYVYDRRNGSLRHPSETMRQPSGPAASYQSAPVGDPARQRAAQRRVAIGGGPAMAETMTGLGMQQELNNMSGAGVNAAGNRARSRARNLQNRGDQRVEDAMRQYGFE